MSCHLMSPSGIDSRFTSWVRSPEIHTYNNTLAKAQWIHGRDTKDDKWRGLYFSEKWVWWKWTRESWLIELSLVLIDESHWGTVLICGCGLFSQMWLLLSHLILARHVIPKRVRENSGHFPDRFLTDGRFWGRQNCPTLRSASAAAKHCWFQRFQSRIPCNELWPIVNKLWNQRR